MNYRSIFIATVQMVGLFLSGIFIPLLPWLLAPVPLILVYVRNSKMEGLTVLGFACLIVTLLGGWYVLFFFFTIFSLAAVCLAEGLLRQWKPEVSIGGGALLPVISVGSIAAYYFTHLGENPISVIERFILEQREEAVKLYSSHGFNEITTAISAIPDISFHYFALMLPCLLILTVATLAACSYAAAKTIILRNPGSGPRISSTPLALWYAPDAWIWGLISAFVCIMIPNETARFILGWNVAVLFVVIYFIQGAALVEYFLKLKLHMRPFARILIHIVILALPPLIAGTIIFGIIDVWADFRKLRKPAATV